MSRLIFANSQVFKINTQIPTQTQTLAAFARYHTHSDFLPLVLSRKLQKFRAIFPPKLFIFFLFIPWATLPSTTNIQGRSLTHGYDI